MACVTKLISCSCDMVHIIWAIWYWPFHLISMTHTSRIASQLKLSSFSPNIFPLIISKILQCVNWKSALFYRRFGRKTVFQWILTTKTTKVIHHFCIAIPSHLSGGNVDRQCGDLNPSTAFSMIFRYTISLTATSHTAYNEQTFFLAVNGYFDHVTWGMPSLNVKLPDVRYIQTSDFRREPRLGYLADGEIITWSWSPETKFSPSNK